MTITNQGYGKFTATNGIDTLTAEFERGRKLEDGRFHPHWNFHCNGTNWTEYVSKEAAVELARKLLTEPIPEPLSGEATAELQRRDESVHGIVAVDLHEIIDNDLEGFLDIINERLTKKLLCELSYRVVGLAEDGLTLHIRVNGYVDDEP